LKFFSDFCGIRLLTHQAPREVCRDEGKCRCIDRFADGRHLGDDLLAGSTFIQHSDHSAKLAVRPFQTLADRVDLFWIKYERRKRHIGRFLLIRSIHDQTVAYPQGYLSIWPPFLNCRPYHRRSDHAGRSVMSSGASLGKTQE